MTFSLAAVFGGVVTGALLGLAGSFTSVEARIAVATVLAVAAVVLGALELSRRTVPLPQWNRETPQRWMLAGALKGAARTGFTLGSGLSTRIGFWLWYAVPAGSFLGGDWRFGMALYGTYGAARGLGPFGVLLASHVARRAGRRELDVGRWLISRSDSGRTIAATQLLALGLAVGVGVGL
jgi:hypothetical protein